jgi:hypothetical protein
MGSVGVNWINLAQNVSLRNSNYSGSVTESVEFFINLATTSFSRRNLSKLTSARENIFTNLLFAVFKRPKQVKNR